MTARDLGPTLRDQIEQATTFGHSIEWMREKYGVTEAFIFAVWDGMDRAHREPASVPMPRRTTGRAPCGTMRAYRQHHYHGEHPCDDCRAANAERSRAIKQRNRESAA